MLLWAGTFTFDVAQYVSVQGQRPQANKMVLYPPPYDQLSADAIMQHVHSHKPPPERYMSKGDMSSNGVVSFVLRTYCFYWILMFLHFALILVLSYRLRSIGAFSTQHRPRSGQRAEKNRNVRESIPLTSDWTRLDVYTDRYRAVMCVFLAVLSLSTIIHVFTLDIDTRSEVLNTTIYRVGCGLEVVVDLVLFGLSTYTVYSFVVQRRNHAAKINESLTVMGKVVEGMVYINLLTAYNVIVIIMIIDGCINAAVWYGTVYVAYDMVIYGLVAFAVYCGLHLAVAFWFSADLPFSVVNYVSMIAIAGDHEIYYKQLFSSKHNSLYDRGVEACLMTVLCIGLVGIAISMLFGLYRLQMVADIEGDRKKKEN